MTLIGDLFEKDVTRTIPPVVYFHEQDPAALQREVEEYIITGGYPKGHPRATEDGIHEQFLRLLRGMRSALDRQEGTDLPAAWISGFYGSGKSSFAKLLGLALDGRRLPDGRSLAEALIAQDHSPDAADLRLAWEQLVSGLQPVAVVFDVGGKARDDEHIHTVIVRQVQERLGYSSTSQLVAEYELKLELEGLYDRFMDEVPRVHGKPWGELKDSQLVEDHFSAVMHALRPELYQDPMSWVDSRSGSAFAGKRSADESVLAIQQMLDRRLPGRTLFIVVDEVSQYVHDNQDRMLALQTFVSALGQRMKGGAWLLATGQQKLEEGTGVAPSIVKLKDRFPPALRVHLGVANIREVVHKRLLRKRKLKESELRELFERYRSELALYAYEGDSISLDDFVEVYPLLPGHVPLLLDITTGLRARSTRTQGDSHAIRGLLQLLGDLFREKKLATYEMGHLVTIDLIFDVLHSALPSDVQATLLRGLEFCKRQQEGEFMARVVKAVAMLELVQDHQKTSAELVARCLYDRLGAPPLQRAVQEALDALVGESVLGYSEKTGYKIESTAGQEWQNERDRYVPTAEQKSAKVREVLRDLMGEVGRVPLEGMEVPWLALYSDDLNARDVHIKDERKYTVATVDFQFTRSGRADEWVPRSDSQAYRDRIVWVVGDVEQPSHAALKLIRSERMTESYGKRQSSIGDEKTRLLMEERNRQDVARAELVEAVKAAFLSGDLYFRGRQVSARDMGATFAAALSAFGNRVARELYPHPTTFSVTEKDIVYLFDNADLSAPPPVLGQDRLGLLALDAGRYEVTCNGRVPADVLAYVKDNGAVTGSTLLAHFGRPPHGVPTDVIRATVIGLLRGRKLRVDLPGLGQLTSVRDEGARELLKEGAFRKAELQPAGTDPIGPRDRVAVCSFFRDLLQKDVARDNDAIMDAVVVHFASVRERLTELGNRFRKLPSRVAYPETLTKLERALERCRKDRKVEPTVAAVVRSLGVLRDGVTLLSMMEGELNDQTISMLTSAANVLDIHWPSLQALGPTDEMRAAAEAIEAHLATDRAWTAVMELSAPVELLRGAYRAERKSVLDAHAKRLEAALEALKRRPGFERLDPDQRHEVLRHLRDGAAANTSEDAVAPPLETLAVYLDTKRRDGEAKALRQLDALLTDKGEKPTVEVSARVAGREVADEGDLERLLTELRDRILHELRAGHRVRLK